MERSPRFKGRVALFVLCAMAFGCGSDAAVEGGLLECDVTNERCQEAIYKSVAASLGADPQATPSIRTISVAEYAAELDAFYEPEEAEVSPWTIAWRLMGFIPNNSTTITDNIIDERLAFVWAYYSSSSKSVTIIDRNYEPGEVNPVLAHEFAHAIQDAQFGIDSIWENVETEDQSVAARSTIEGDAEYVEWSWYFDADLIDPALVRWNAIHEDGKSWLLARVRDPGVRFIDTVSSFPYVYGFEFATGARLADGLQARRTIWASPPRSTAAIMKGYRAFNDGGTNLGPPFMFAHPSPPAGYELFGETPLGMWYLYAFLIRHGLSEAQAWSAAEAMSADSFATFQGDPDIAAVWRMRFDGAQNANLVADVVRSALSSLFANAVVQANDVFIIMANSETALASWVAQPLDANTAVAAKSHTRGQLPPISSGTCIQFH